MFGEPPQTEYDWRFNILNVPVRVHPFFWLLTAMLGMNNSGRGIIIWIAVVFVSILVHELGHALVIRYFGWAPRIVLHSFGGLAIYDPNFSPFQSGRRPRRTHATQILISLAGPFAGFLLAAIVIAILLAGSFPLAIPFVGLISKGERRLPNLDVALLVSDLLYVNICWGILNLLPIYPLDGGQVARELMMANIRDGLRMSLQLSLATAAVIAILAVVRYESVFLGLMFGYMAYNNYQQLNGPVGGGGFGRPW